MKVYFPVTIDLDFEKPLKMLKVKQSDSGRGLLVTLRANLEFQSALGETCTAYVVRQDNSVIELACAVTQEGLVQVDFTEESLNYHGLALVEMKIENNQTAITTPIIRLDVRPTFIE